VLQSIRVSSLRRTGVRHACSCIGFAYHQCNPTCQPLMCRTMTAKQVIVRQAWIGLLRLSDKGIVSVARGGKTRGQNFGHGSPRLPGRRVVRFAVFGLIHNPAFSLSKNRFAVTERWPSLHELEKHGCCFITSTHHSVASGSVTSRHEPKLRSWPVPLGSEKCYSSPA